VRVRARARVCVCVCVCEREGEGGLRGEKIRSSKGALKELLRDFTIAALAFVVAEKCEDSGNGSWISIPKQNRQRMSRSVISDNPWDTAEPVNIPTVSSIT